MRSWACRSPWLPGRMKCAPCAACASKLPTSRGYARKRARPCPRPYAAAWSATPKSSTRCSILTTCWADSFAADEVRPATRTNSSMAAQVRLGKLVIGGDVGGRALRHHMAAFHDVGPVGQRQGQPGHLVHQQDRHVFVTQSVQ